jgi:peptidoglycan/xylan/chitin deacetylase (PgdA/CDA1 family)
MRRFRSLVGVSALLVATGAWAGPAAPVALAKVRTVVTIQFDDGVADQAGTLAILKAHGMHATFFVNSAVVGDAEHMSWRQLKKLAAAGNEIAGHTLHHVGLKALKTAEARKEVCGDRNRLLKRGFEPTSFAYPFGSYDSGTEDVVRDCGYNSGRGVSGISYKGGRAVYAETIPPLDAYSTRTPPNPKQGATLATLKDYVRQAEQHGGGWVQFVFHHLCDGCDAYSVTVPTFTALLDWLEGRTGRGTVVRTTAQVIGGTVKGPVQP